MKDLDASLLENVSCKKTCSKVIAQVKQVRREERRRKKNAERVSARPDYDKEGKEVDIFHRREDKTNLEDESSSRDDVIGEDWQLEETSSKSKNRVDRTKISSEESVGKLTEKSSRGRNNDRSSRSYRRSEEELSDVASRTAEDRIGYRSSKENTIHSKSSRSVALRRSNERFEEAGTEERSIGKSVRSKTKDNVSHQSSKIRRSSASAMKDLSGEDEFSELSQGKDLGQSLKRIANKEMSSEEEEEEEDLEEEKELEEKSLASKGKSGKSSMRSAEDARSVNTNKESVAGSSKSGPGPSRRGPDRDPGKGPRKDPGRGPGRPGGSERGSDGDSEIDMENWDEQDHSPCSLQCPVRLLRERLKKRNEDLQHLVDDYLLNKGMNYFRDICTCSFRCAFRQICKDYFFRSTICSLIIFGLGIKLTCELRAWYIPAPIFQ
ncbi:ESF1 homolog [Orussus abietinus]|uniref:ESF1 homolog n=1 Tax=Orussus abietinus TaxID=222816 RepID=UPI000C715C5C|nr:ESF1 homolog [Orussus abietinus]